MIHAAGTRTAFSPDDHDIDIGMASRRITDIEKDDLRDRGNLTDPAAEGVIARDGVAVVVHEGTTVPSLSLDLSTAEARRARVSGLSSRRAR